MEPLGKLLIVAGIVLVVIGLVLWKTGGLGPLGHLPGDIYIQRPHSTFSFPITTCLAISAVLSLIMWLLRR